MTPRVADDGGVVHVVPSPRGRGAQRAARILVDRLNQFGPPRHRLLALYDGPPEVETDLSLAHTSRRGRPAEGFDPRLALRLRTTLRRLHPAAVVAHGGDAMKYGLPAVIGSGTPLVYCVIGTYAGPETVPHVWVWKGIMTAASLVVAVGHEVAEECTGRFGARRERVVEIPNGRDPTLFHPRHGTAAGPPALVFVAALTPQKRPHRFVEVVQRLRATDRSFRAMMVGDGPLAATLKPFAEAQGIEVLGARSDVPDLLRSADLFLFTSLPAGEGMPGVLIEAGLSGLASVSFRVPGAAEVIDDGVTGLVVEDSTTAMVEAVGLLLDNPDQRSAMGADAHIRCESEFNLDLMARRWQAALRPLLRQEPPARPAGTLSRADAALRRAARSRRRSSQT
jgi:glycosyltransferase involved in cell wall biosynthesis